MEIYQILYIPTASYLTSINRTGIDNTVYFQDKNAAKTMIDYIINKKPFFAGAPIYSFYINSIPVDQLNIISEKEFDIVSKNINNVDNLKILKL